MGFRFANQRRWGAAVAALGWLRNGLVIVALFVLVPTVAIAQQSTSQARIVVIVPVVRPDAVEVDFLRNLRWQLAELDLTLAERKAPASSDLFDYVTEAEQETKSSEALLVAWIAHEQAGMVVYLYDPRGPHLHARAVAVSESPAAASEELALIVSSAILARLEGEDFAMDEVALPRPAVPVPPPPRPAPPRPLPIPQEPREPWGAAGLGAVGTKPLSHANWQIGLDLRAWGRVRPLRFGLGYSLYRGLTVSSELAKIIVYRHPIDAWIGLEVWTDKINILTEAAFTVDPIQRDTLATSAPLASQAPNWRWLWAVSGRVRGEAEVAASLWVTAAVGAEIPLNPFTFEIAIAEQHQPIARILRVRPTADLGLILLWK